MSDDVGGSSDGAYDKARERVEEIKGLYIHLLVYGVINAGLFAINYFSSGGDGPWWFYWPLLGWGIGMAIHAAVTVFEGPFGSRWEERKIRALMDRERAAMDGERVALERDRSSE